MESIQKSKIERFRDVLCELRDRGIIHFVGVMIHRLIMVTIVWPPTILFVLVIAFSEFHPLNSIAKIAIESAEDYAALPGAGKGQFVSSRCDDEPQKLLNAIPEKTHYICEKTVYASEDMASAIVSATKVFSVIYIALAFCGFGMGMVFWGNSPLALRGKTANFVETSIKGLFQKIFRRPN